MFRIYLDTNVWGQPFDAQTQRIRKETETFFEILEGAYQHKYEIIGTLILEDEIEQMEGKEKREAVKVIVEIYVAEKITKFSESLQKEIKALGLKDKDAIHLAFAIDNTDYFITCDDEILNRRRTLERKYRIKVVNPVEFVREVL